MAVLWKMVTKLVGKEDVDFKNFIQERIGNRTFLGGRIFFCFCAESYIACKTYELPKRK